MQVGATLPPEWPGDQRPTRPQPTEHAALDHLGAPAAGPAGRRHQPRARQLFLPVVGWPLQQAPGLDAVNGGVAAEHHAPNPSSSWVLTPTWAEPGTEGRIWRTPARQPERCRRQPRIGAGGMWV
jgi:hypothetical protein